MPKVEQFEKNAARYDGWFDRHPEVFVSELNAIKSLMPSLPGLGVEIGAGSGRFSEALKVTIAVEPSPSLRKLAQARGVDVVDGVAESLPFMPNWFGYALMINVLCFVDDPLSALKEARRVLKPNGSLIMAIIDKESALGATYAQRKEEDSFYRDARFFSTAEAAELLRKAGFSNIEFCQTIFKDPKDIKEPEPVKEGHGEGSFVVIRAVKA